MKRQKVSDLFKGLILVSLGVVSCTEISERKLLLFSVQDVQDVAQAERISAEKVEADVMDLTGFAVLDNRLIATSQLGTDHCLDVIDLDSGETLHQLCRVGRGPGEFLNISPLFSTTGEAAVVYDSMTGMVSEVSVDGEKVGDIIHQVKLEVPSEKGPPIIMACYKVNDENLVAYNSIQAPFESVSIENPYYAIYDYETGTETRAFHLFNARPLNRSSEWTMMSAFSLSDCLNEDKTLLCFVMGKMPVLGFVDITTGEVKGFRLKGKPSYTTDSPLFYFAGVCAHDQYIYALYFGNTSTERRSANSLTTLYKFDWEGHVLKKYELDGTYMGCYATSNKLYLSKSEGSTTWSLYQLNINKL